MQPKSTATVEDGAEVVSDDDIVRNIARHIEEQVPEALDKSHAHPTTFRIMVESGLVRLFCLFVVVVLCLPIQFSHFFLSFCCCINLTCVDGLVGCCPESRIGEIQ